MINEIKKLLRQRLFNLLIFFLLVIQVFLVVNHNLDISKMYRLKDSINIETYEKYLAYEDYQFSLMIGEPLEVQDYFYDVAFLQDYEENYHPEYKEYLVLEKEISRMNEAYPKYVEDIISNEASIKDKRLKSMYTKLNRVEFNVDDSMPLLSLTNDFQANYYLLIFSFILGFYLSHVDKGQFDFYDTISNGIRRLNKYKIFTIIVYTVVFVFLSHLLNILSLKLLYNNISLHSAIQNIPQMIQSPFNFTIGKMLVISVLWQSFIAIILALIVYFISVRSDNALLMSLIFYGIILLLSIFITSKSSYIWINFINPISQINAFLVFARYKLHFNKFLLPEVILIIYSVFFILLIGFVLRVKPKLYQRKEFKFNKSFKAHTNISKHRLQLMFNNYNGLIVIILLFIISLSLVTNDRSKEFTNAFINRVNERSEVFRNNSIQDLELKQEASLLLEKNISILHESGENKELLEEYMQEYMASITDNRIEKEVLKLMEQGEVVEPSGYRLLFAKNSQAEDYKLSFLLLGFMVPFLSYLYSVDEAEENTKLTKTLTHYINDKRSLFNVGILFTVLSFIIVNGMRLILYQNVFIFDKTIISTYLWEFSNFPSELNTLHYSLALYSSRFIGVILLTIMIFVLAQRIKSPWKTSLIVTILVLVPHFIKVLTPLDMSYISVFDLILGNYFLNRSNLIVKLPFIILLLSYFVLELKPKKIK